MKSCVRSSGKAVCVVKPERRPAVERAAGFPALDFLVQKPEATAKRLLEAGLLELQRFTDQRLRTAEFRILRAHLGDQRRYEPVHHRLAAAKLVEMAHGAAHDPAQHIAAPLVRGQNTIGNQE